MLWAFDHECKIKLHAVGYVERSFNPFESYMWHYSELKNTMDALKVMLELNDSTTPHVNEVAHMLWRTWSPTARPADAAAACWCACDPKSRLIPADQLESLSSDTGCHRGQSS